MLSRRRLLAAAPFALLAGCATRYDTEATLPRFELQNKALTPHNGGLAIDSAALQPGDIVLSATRGMASLGIRIATLSPVSHAALYVGRDEVAEAVGDGIQRRGMRRVLEEESTVVAFRHPGVRAEHVERMQAFVDQNVGQKYNLVGVMLQAPFAIDRKLCELPLTPSVLRDFCVQGLGAVHLGLGRSDRFFCSQFVLEAFNRAGLPLTTADPRLLTPADLLHMREGDVPSVHSHQVLQYVGHLKFEPAAPPA